MHSVDSSESLENKNIPAVKCYPQWELNPGPPTFMLYMLLSELVSYLLQVSRHLDPHMEGSCYDLGSTDSDTFQFFKIGLPDFYGLDQKLLLLCDRLSLLGTSKNFARIRISLHLLPWMQLVIICDPLPSTHLELGKLWLWLAFAVTMTLFSGWWWRGGQKVFVF